MSVAILLPHGAGIRLAKEFIISYAKENYPHQDIFLFVPDDLVDNIESYASRENLTLVVYTKSFLFVSSFF